MPCPRCKPCPQRRPCCHVRQVWSTSFSITWSTTCTMRSRHGTLVPSNIFCTCSAQGPGGNREFLQWQAAEYDHQAPLRITDQLVMVVSGTCHVSGQLSAVASRAEAQEQKVCVPSIRHLETEQKYRSKQAASPLSDIRHQSKGTGAREMALNLVSEQCPPVS